MEKEDDQVRKEEEHGDDVKSGNAGQIKEVLYYIRKNWNRFVGVVIILNISHVV